MTDVRHLTDREIVENLLDLLQPASHRNALLKEMIGRKTIRPSLKHAIVDMWEDVVARQTKKSN